MLDFCLKCDFYDDCTEECRVAQDYTNQDRIPEDPHHIAYVSPNSLEYLSEKSTLTHAEMVQDDPFTEETWKVIQRLNLPNMQMQVFRLYYWESKIQSEIAKILGIAQQTVSEYVTIVEFKLSHYLKDRVELLKRIEEAKLTEKQYEIAILYYGEQFTQRELANRLEVSEPTIADHIRKIKKILGIA